MNIQYFIGILINNPLIEALVIGIIVIIVSAFVGFIISTISSEKHHTFIKALVTGSIVGIIVFFLTGGTAGNLLKEEGSEVKPNKIIDEEVNLEATEISLEYKNNEQNNTFNIILDGQKIDTGSNWLENLKNRLKQYKKLKVIKVKNTKQVQNDIIEKDLKTLNENFNDIKIIFEGINENNEN